jgi:hypothetical protein
MILLLLAIGVNTHFTTAQEATATAVRVIIASATAVPTDSLLATPTPSWTPTAEGPAQLEAKAEAGEVNVRAEPDTSAQRLGAIQAGEQYVVRGRYFSWYQFDYASSPTGTAWVYGELVTIIGNPSDIPDIDPYAIPTSPADAAATQTLAVALATPGGDATATADARILVIPTSTVDVSAALGQDGSLPTYTPPAEYVLRVVEGQQAVEQEGALLAAINNVTTQGVSPIAPIAGLAVVGILGLALSFLRR